MQASSWDAQLVSQDLLVVGRPLTSGVRIAVSVVLAWRKEKCRRMEGLTNNPLMTDSNCDN